MKNLKLTIFSKSSFLFSFLFCLLPFASFAVPTKPEQFELLERELSLACSEYGEESCTARFIAMAACTFVFGINQGKQVGEALNIADGVFVSIMRGNKIKPSNMFNQDGNIKTVIRDEVKDRVRFCKDATEKAIPKIVLERTGKQASPEFITGATKTYGEWWLRTLEDINRKGK